MSKLSSVFLGTPEFALSSLEAAFDKTELLAVISQPDRARGRGQKLSPSPIKARAQELGIPVFSPPSLKKPSAELDELWKFLTARIPDLLLVTAYGNLLPQNFLDLPKIGPINVHASLLPRWRGAAPIQRALEAGDTETGVSLQKMVMALDAGDVLAEERLPLPNNWDAHQLTETLASAGGKLLAKYLGELSHREKPVLTGQTQAAELVTIAPKISKEQATYSPKWGAVEMHNRVRAFSAWPKVEATLVTGKGVQKLKILGTKVASPSTPAVSGKFILGKLILEDGKVWLGTSDGTLEILKIQPENRGPVEAFAFLKNLAQDGALQLSHT